MKKDKLNHVYLVEKDEISFVDKTNYGKSEVFVPYILFDKLRSPKIIRKYRRTAKRIFSNSI